MGEKKIKAYILDNDRVVKQTDYRNAISAFEKVLDNRETAGGAKALDLLDTSVREESFIKNILASPVDTELLEAAYVLNSTHYRCCVIKAEDTTSKGFILEQKELYLESDRSVNDSTEHTDEISPEKKELNKEITKAREFLEKTYEGNGQKALMDYLIKDYEHIGWCCCEVLRTVDGDIYDLIPVPAKEIRWSRDGYLIQGRNPKLYSYPHNSSLAEPASNFFSQGGTPSTFAYNNKLVRFLPFGQKFIFKKGYKGNRRVDSITLIAADANIPAEDTVSIEDSANELLFLPKHGSVGGLYGIPDILSALVPISNNVSIDDYLTKFFDNNAVPQYAVIVEGADDLDDQVVQLIRAYFKEKIKGKPYSTLIVSTPEGVTLKFEKLATDIKEASFQDTKKLNREDILTAHGIGPAQIGIIEATNLGGGTGQSQAENYKNRIILPLQMKFQEEFWGKIFGWEGKNLTLIALRYIELDIRDYEELRKQHSSYLDRGAITINETRKELGYPPVSGGNRAFIRLANEIIFVDAFEGAGPTVGGNVAEGEGSFQTNPPPEDLEDAYDDDEENKNEDKDKEKEKKKKSRGFFSSLFKK